MRYVKFRAGQLVVLLHLLVSLVLISGCQPDSKIDIAYGGNSIENEETDFQLFNHVQVNESSGWLSIHIKNQSSEDVDLWRK